MDIVELRNRLQGVSKFGGYKRFQQTKDILREFGIEVESTGGANLGRCYNSMTFVIRSTEELSEEVINVLWKSDVLGYGQEFTFQKPILRDDRDDFSVRFQSGKSGRLTG